MTMASEIKSRMSSVPSGQSHKEGGGVHVTPPGTGKPVSQPGGCC